MRTFADLKRTIQAGTRIHVILHEYRTELTGTMRTVTRAQTNGFYYKSDGDAREFWSPYGKAGQYTFPAADTWKYTGPPMPHGNGNSVGWTMRVIGGG